MAALNGSNSRKKPLLVRFISFVFQLGIMIVLPFVLLMRGTNWLYETQGWPWWGGLVVMSAVNVLILLVYVAMLWDAVIGPGKMSRRSIKGKLWFVTLLVMSFLGVSLFNLSGEYAKSEQVQTEYTAMHPMLRLSVGTLVLFNQQLLITDMNRAPEDYQSMGLRSKKHSLHYKQTDGFVHAMDLRTNGHSELRNTLLKTYFTLMGFNTLRHTGTADHLHVSFFSHDRPNAI